MKRLYSLLALLMMVVMTATAQNVKTSNATIDLAKKAAGTFAKTGEAPKAKSYDFGSSKLMKSELSVAQAPSKAPAKAHETDTWTSLGSGSYTDDVTSVYGLAPTTVSVEIQESNENPGLYRLVDPYAAVCEVIGGAYDDSSVHYMYIDATNPAEVFVEDFYTGLTLNSQDGEIILVNGANYPQYGGAYGTLVDGVITFAAKTLFCTFTGDTGLYYANSNGKFKVVLPGVVAKDYSVEVVADYCAANNSIPFSITTGADVAGVKIIVLEGSYSFSAGNYQIVAAQGDDIEAGNWVFSMGEDDEYGRYTIFVATVDEAGNYQDGEGTYFYFVNYNDDENWKSLGMVPYGEDFIGSVFNADPSEFLAELQENVNTLGFYRLVNAYGENFPYNSYNDHEADHDHYLYIHAEDPENVWIEESPIGQDWGYGGMSVASLAENFDGEADYGTMVDGLITFPTKALVMAMQTNNHGGWLYANRNDMFYVQVPVAEDTRIKDILDIANGDYPMSSGSGVSAVHDGDITETTTYNSANELFTMTVTPSEKTTPNRFWQVKPKDGDPYPQLRIYGGSVTIQAAEGMVMSKVEIEGTGLTMENPTFTVNGMDVEAFAAVEGCSAEATNLVWAGETDKLVLAHTASKGNFAINSIKVIFKGAEKLYEADGVVGGGTDLDKGMPFFNTPVKVEAYDDNTVIIRGWDGTEGSDLKVIYTTLNTLEEGEENEVRTVIIGLEQTVNGEVVSEFVGDEEYPDYSYVRLEPQSEEYPACGIFVAHELTGIKLGEGEEAGMGQLSLYGMWTAGAAIGGEDDNMGMPEPFEAAYIVTWPGKPVEVAPELVAEVVGATEDLGDAWGESAVSGIRDIKVEMYDNGTAIVRGWMGVEGYDIKLAYESESGEITGITPIVNGVEGETVTDGWCAIRTGAANFYAANAYVGYSYSMMDDDPENGFIYLVAHFYDSNGGFVSTYYYLAWPQSTPITWEPEFDSSKLYNISNAVKTDAYWQDNGNGVIDCHEKNDASEWIFYPTANENCYYIMNASTYKFVQAHGDETQVEVALDYTPAEFYIVYSEAEGAWGIASTEATVYDFTEGCVGLNLKKDPNEEGCCVQTYAAVAGTNHRSFWKIAEAGGTDITTVKANDGDKARKIIENGQIVIVRNGVKYNVAGVVIK